MAATVATPSSVAVACLRLHLVHGMRPGRFGRLLRAHGSAAAVTQLDPGVLRGGGRRPAVGRPADVDREVNRARRGGAAILCVDDAGFPELLREIPDPPLCLYVFGDPAALAGPAVAVVGSRAATIYGRKQAFRFGLELAQCGVTVVSGLASGIDCATQQSVVAAGGCTVAVLGCGLSGLRHHGERTLGQAILDGGGAVISEFPMDLEARPAQFPQRNRIIAGMSHGTLVVEAAERSGALITARLATEYNREVFAVPGPADSPTSVGTHRLIQRGTAKLVMTIEDLLAELQHIQPALAAGFEQRAAAVAQRVAPQLTPDERRVLEHLTRTGVDLEALCDQCALPPERLSSALVTLQLKQVVEQLPGTRYAALI